MQHEVGYVPFDLATVQLKLDDVKASHTQLGVESSVAETELVLVVFDMLDS